MSDIEVQQVYGIPIGWFYEVDSACDAFFRRRGMRVGSQSLRERIYEEIRVGRDRKRAKQRRKPNE